MNSKDLSIEAMLEQQEVIALQKLKEEKEQAEHARVKDDDAGNASNTPPRDRERDRERDRDRGRRDDHHRRRRERDHYDGRRAGPRTSSDRYMSEREENDQRRSRRSKDLADDTDVRPGSDRDSTNGRNRSRSPRSDRRDGRRYRSRTRSPRRSPRGDRSYRPNGRHHDRHDDDRNADSRATPTEGRSKNPELTEEQRDRRTVFCQQLANRTKNGHLKKFFEQVGVVREAMIVVDRVSGRSKGVGYVEFAEESSVPGALKLTGRQLNGIPIIVANTEADKNRSARTKETTTNRNNTQPQTRLYVGNIQFSLNEEDLVQVFQPWGELKHVVLQKDDGGRSRGYAFVEYTTADSAKQALENMNNFMLGDRAIRVGLGGDRNSNFPEADKADVETRVQGSSFSGMGGRGTHAGGSGSFDRGGGRDTDKTGGASALDDVDMEGVNFNNFNRDALMRKLARKDDIVQPSAPKTEPKKAVFDEPNPTRCILLKNVYDKNTEAEANWQESIKRDIRDECSSKYGKVVHIELDIANGDGDVYLKFADVSGGQKAYRGLQGRWFDKHQIRAQYVVDIVYNSLYPKAANV